MHRRDPRVSALQSERSPDPSSHLQQFAIVAGKHEQRVAGWQLPRPLLPALQRDELTRRDQGDVVQSGRRASKGSWRPHRLVASITFLAFVRARCT